MRGDAAASVVVEDRTAVEEDHTVVRAAVEEDRTGAEDVVEVLLVVVDHTELVEEDRIVGPASVVEDRTVVPACAGCEVDRSKASARQSAS